ncbi:hypothetical protein [Noviherbaspirillum malthae]|uniref:hypothetical protein n=1 Tax=Noviherbaspirillum malthae TaxID=1260987 RepID=UPI001E5B0F87|nr:hypothetical protein [Noviherbaspirillum malthae]
MQLKITDLEAMFAEAGTDTKQLKKLEAELQYRNVPRAIALLDKVQKAIKLAKTASLASPAPCKAAPDLEQPLTPPPGRQPQLWDEPKSPLPVAAPVSSAPAHAVAKPSTSLPPAAALHPAKPATPVTTVEDDDVEQVPWPLPEEAYKILKVAPSANWELIEKARRQLVQHSHPDNLATLSPDRRAQVRYEAKRANAACQVIWQSRQG